MRAKPLRKTIKTLLEEANINMAAIRLQTLILELQQREIWDMIRKITGKNKNRQTCPY